MESIHIALASIPLSGHIIPLARLARWLLDTSPKPNVYITFTVLLNDTVDGKVDFPQHANFRVVSKPNVETSNWLGDMQRCNEEAAKEFLPTLVAPFQDWPPIKAVVYDCVTPYGQLIADDLKIPAFVFFAPGLHYLWSFAQTPQLNDMRAQEHPAQKYTIPALGAFSLGPRPAKDDPMEKSLEKLWVICIAAYKKSKGCLVNDSQSLYPTEYLASLPIDPLPAAWNILCCGCLAKTAYQPTPELEGTDLVEQFMNKFPAKSVVYVSLGSWWALEDQDLVGLARGLANAEHPFLFAYRGKASKDTFTTSSHVEINEETDPDGLPRGFRDAVRGRGLIVDWVDQIKVLQHPSLGAFLTHCGWNSTIEALGLSGVPLLLLPIHGDQLANAEMVANVLECGLVISTPGARLEQQRITDAVNKVFRDQGLRKQAETIQQRMMDEISTGQCDKIKHQFLELVQSG